jgi:hypothetical protein
VSQDDPIRVFASHAFQDHDDYHRFFEYLESTVNFFYKNSAAPDKKPPDGTDEALQEELREQIKPAEVVIVFASLYGDFQKWINFILLVTQEAKKPIIVMEYFGSTQEIAPEIAGVADEVVAWNERSIVDAIRRQARHEETQRWDVVEFDMPE